MKNHIIILYCCVLWLLWSTPAKVNANEPPNECPSIEGVFKIEGTVNATYVVYDTEKLNEILQCYKKKNQKKINNDIIKEK